MTDQSGDGAFTRTELKGTSIENTFAGANSFMRRRYTRDLAGVDVAVTGVPFDLATSNRPGARFGPAGIRRASANLAWGPIWPWNFDPFDTLAVVDYGDCAFDHGKPGDIPAVIEAHAAGILDGGASILTLGGDHFVTLPLLRAHAAKHGPLALVHFDAHRDLEPDEGGRIDHGTMFRHAVTEGLIDPKRSVQIGIRTAYEGEGAAGDDDFGFTVIDAAALAARAPADVAREIVRVVGDARAYLTFDIDCLDPSCAPGTGTPVVGGPSTATVLSILRGLKPIDFAGMDVVEVAPVYDSGEITSLAAATIAVEYLCLLASRFR